VVFLWTIRARHIDEIPGQARDDSLGTTYLIITGFLILPIESILTSNHTVVIPDLTRDLIESEINSEIIALENYTARNP
jgi:hypothetical protein